MSQTPLARGPDPDPDSTSNDGNNGEHLEMLKKRTRDCRKVLEMFSDKVEHLQRKIQRRDVRIEELEVYLTLERYLRNKEKQSFERHQQDLRSERNLLNEKLEEALMQLRICLGGAQESEELRKTRTTNRELNTANENLIREIDDLKNQLNMCQNHAKKVAAEDHKKYNKLQKENDDLRIELNKWQEHDVKAQHELGDLKGKVNDLSARLQNCEANREISQGQSSEQPAGKPEHHSDKSDGKSPSPPDRTKEERLEKQKPEIAPVVEGGRFVSPTKQSKDNTEGKQGLVGASGLTLVATISDELSTPGTQQLDTGGQDSTHKVRESDSLVNESISDSGFEVITTSPVLSPIEPPEEVPVIQPIFGHNSPFDFNPEGSFSTTSYSLLGHSLAYLIEARATADKLAQLSLTDEEFNASRQNSADTQRGSVATDVEMGVDPNMVNEENAEMDTDPNKPFENLEAAEGIKGSATTTDDTRIWANGTVVQPHIPPLLAPLLELSTLNLSSTASTARQPSRYASTVSTVQRRRPRSLAAPATPTASSAQKSEFSLSFSEAIAAVKEESVKRDTTPVVQRIQELVNTRTIYRLDVPRDHDAKRQSRNPVGSHIDSQNEISEDDTINNSITPNHDHGDLDIPDNYVLRLKKPKPKRDLGTLGREDARLENNIRAKPKDNVDRSPEAVRKREFEKKIKVSLTRRAHLIRLLNIVVWRARPFAGHEPRSLLMTRKALRDDMDDVKFSIDREIGQFNQANPYQALTINELNAEYAPVLPTSNFRMSMKNEQGRLSDSELIEAEMDKEASTGGRKWWAARSSRQRRRRN